MDHSSFFLLLIVNSHFISEKCGCSYLHNDSVLLHRSSSIRTVHSYLLKSTLFTEVFMYIAPFALSFNKSTHFQSYLCQHLIVPILQSKLFPRSINSMGLFCHILHSSGIHQFYFLIALINVHSLRSNFQGLFTSV